MVYYHDDVIVIVFSNSSQRRILNTVRQLWRNNTMLIKIRGACFESLGISIWFQGKLEESAENRFVRYWIQHRLQDKQILAELSDERVQRLLPKKQKGNTVWSIETKIESTASDKLSVISVRVDVLELTYRYTLTWTWHALDKSGSLHTLPHWRGMLWISLGAYIHFHIDVACSG